MYITGSVYIGNLCAGNIEPADEPASADAYRDALVAAILGAYPGADVSWRVVNADGYVGYGDQTHVYLDRDEVEDDQEADQRRQEIEAEIEEIEGEIFQRGEFWVIPEPAPGG